MDTIVIGAGLTGLTAADELTARGLDVSVLESRRRVGGRTYSVELAGEAVDLGAEFVGMHHRRGRRLAGRLGLKLQPSRLLSRRAHWQLGGASKVGHLPPLTAREVASTLRLFARQNRLSRPLDINEPWAAPSARSLDAISLADWLEAEQPTGRALELQQQIWRGFMQSEPDSLSMLHLLWMVRRGGGWPAGMRDTVALRVPGGTQQLALGLAARLGSRVELSKVVTRVEQEDGGVRVLTADGDERTAAQAILAVPIPALRWIDFTPALPPELDAMRRELRFAQGAAVLVGGPGAARGKFDLAFGDSHFNEGWRRGSTAKALVPVPGAPGGLEAIGTRLADAFGIPTGGFEMRTQAWAEERFTGGTYVVFGRGQLTRFGPLLRKPHGRVHFAGAERSSWPDFMEGAIESGSRAARDVLAAHTATAPYDCALVEQSVQEPVAH